MQPLVSVDLTSDASLVSLFQNKADIVDIFNLITAVQSASLTMVGLY